MLLKTIFCVPMISTILIEGIVGGGAFLLGGFLAPEI